MADTGAVIKAIVKCNVAGQTTKELTVSGENETGSPSTPQNPAEPESQQQITGYALLIPIACIWALFEIKKTLKKRVLSN